MEKTFVTKASDIRREWFVVDADGQNLGRLASRIASVLRGKHKPIFTPGLDTGDFVVVVNAGKVTVTGNKMEEKVYFRHSNYPGGLRRITLRQQLDKHPTRVLTAAVRGMLPRGRLGRAMIKKLKVYATADHPHAAQQPKPLA